MDDLMLFVDGSVNPQTNTGFGAYLAVSDMNLPIDFLKTRVKLKRFAHTSSTKLELQTIIWALTDIRSYECRIVAYTDSQSIMGLQGRRDRFEKNDYCSKKKRRLNNFELYRDFYAVTDRLGCDFIKVHGHQVSNQKNQIDRFFTLVDRASRAALRKETT